MTTLINLTNAQLEARLKQDPKPLLLDVRTQEEYDVLGHIPEALLLPIQELEVRLSELDPERETVVICEHGVRSANAASYLLYKGFHNISHLSAGMAEWTGAREF
jgi:rhodanese-related sulfurtransferase